MHGSLSWLQFVPLFSRAGVECGSKDGTVAAVVGSHDLGLERMTMRKL